MIISKKWLDRFISFNLSNQKIDDILTEIGLEVASVSKYEEIKGNLEGIVVGEVTSCTKHPNADKLQCTQVKINDSTTLNITCGAPNVAKGQKVLVAQVGSTIHPLGENEGVQIKKAKIRGEVSEGMICGESEIGFESDFYGILELPKETKIGTPASEYYDLYSDTLFEIEIIPNRADALSHYGVARDLKSYFTIHDIPFKWKGITVPSNDFSLEKNSSNKIEFEIQDSDSCPTYCGTTLEGLELKPSPIWMQRFLKSIGIQPKNNLVDITNFVLHDIGQPQHIFDAEKIKDKKIIIRKAENKEKITILSGKEVELSTENLLIADTQNPLCIAGVMGGKHSGVSDITKNIFLETAYFNPVTIRKSSKLSDLKSDSSYRYERGIDPNIYEIAAIQTIDFLIKEANAKLVTPLEIKGNKIAPHFNIQVSFSRINRLLGLDIRNQIIFDILSSLEIDFSPENESTDVYNLKVPPYRVDVQREADIAEEILRIYGINKVDTTEWLQFKLPQFSAKNIFSLQKKLSTLLSNFGYNEAMNISFLSEQNITSHPKESIVSVYNPLNIELEHLRPSLSIGMLKSIVYNQNRKNMPVRLYEFGKSYSQDASKNRIEENCLAIAVCGSNPKTWNTLESKSLFYDLKADVLELLSLVYPSNILEEKVDEKSFFNFQLFAKNKKIAQISIIDDKTLEEYDLKNQVYYAEVNITELLDNYVQKPIFYNIDEVSKFIGVQRDISFIISNEVSYLEIKKVVKNIPFLTQINLMDLYQGANIPKGKKSLTLSFNFHNPESTLSESEIQKSVQKIIEKLQKSFDLEIRLS